MGRSKWLLRNNLNEMRHFDCARKIERSRGITDFPSQLCASNSISGNSLCSDSTGSFVGRIENGVQIVHGVKSFVVSGGQGQTCYEKAITVFTRVANHIDWIESIVWSLGGQ